MLIPAGLVRRGRQPRHLAAQREAVARDVVGGPVVDDPLHDRVDVGVGLVEAGDAVGEGVVDGRGGGCGGVGRAVVGGDGGAHVEEHAVVVEDALRAAAGAVARAERLDEAVAPRRGVRADPVG